MPALSVCLPFNGRRPPLFLLAVLALTAICFLQECEGFLQDLNHLLAVLGRKSLEVTVELWGNFEIERCEHGNFCLCCALRVAG
jgi:hypothetical protein